MAHTTGNIDHLIRSEIWSNELKEVLEDDLFARQYVRWMTEFPDGDTFTIPSIGQATVRDYSEDAPVQYDALDTGEFQFSITEYLSSATYITDKAKQDSFYMSELTSSFVPKQARAISEHVESTIMALANDQTSGNLNAINGANHRFVGNGSNETITVEDFARAKFALQKANVPIQNLVAVVDPSVGYEIETLTNLVNVSDNPTLDGVITEGLMANMEFKRNIFGFNVFVSNYLADANETIDGKTTSSGKANLFFSATPDIVPFIGAWRQTPRVESERNKDRQRDEFVTTARYGVKLYRPENLVTVLTDDDQVS
jgi:hypothetical protein